MTDSNSLDLQIRAGMNRRANDELKIPQRYRKKSLDMLKDLDQEIRTARRAISNGRGVFLWGPCGTGKTHLAMGLLLEWYGGIITAWRYGVEQPKAHKRGAFVSMIELLLDLKETFTGRQGEGKLLRAYREIDFMLIDDLCAERITDWSRGIVSDLIVMRHQDMRQTIITTNLDLEGISRNIDDRVASRIGEMCEVVKIDGPDYRTEHKPDQQQLLAIGEKRG